MSEQIQDSVQDIGQGGSQGNTGVSPAQDIANSYGDEQDAASLGAQSDSDVEVEEEVVNEPFHKNPRWKKLLKERNTLREQMRALQERSQQYESKEFQSATMLRDLLQSRPQYASLLLRLFNGENPNQVVNEIFRAEQQAEANQRPPEEEYDPRTAQYFKEIEELKRWKQEQQTEQQKFMKEQVQSYQKDLDAEYERRLAEDGFIDQSGKPVDDKFVTLVDSATKAILQSTAKNPDIPTVQEFDQAYSTMKQCVKYMEEKIRRDMSKKSVSNVPPLSGTSNGQMPIGKVKITDQDRVMDIANSFWE